MSDAPGQANASDVPAASVKADAAVPPSAPSSGRRRLLVVVAIVAIVAGPAVVWFVWRPSPSPPQPTDPFPLTPLSSSPFLNTRPEARYVGSEACRGCHGREHASFRRTGMGRSMAEVTPDLEPPDTTFDHPASKRRYQIQRKDGQIWHREFLLTGGKDEIVLAEYPLKYVIGSGRHSRTYAVEAEGFLVESPVTWYASGKGWKMSPGYDNPHQQGFDRAVGDGCLICHAGQADAVGASLHRMQVTEAAIGCERCHGPGSLHVAHHAGRKPVAERVAGVDYTIVNPAHLSRDLAEAVCQQCHLRSNATIVARGRKPADYRPGLPLHEFRQDYGLDHPDASMTVVGHVEQMHLSRCYQNSKTLSCLTCHNPHDEPAPRERVAHYRAVCLECHKPAACRETDGRRQAKADSCIHCHMPTSPTEIPHLAFTHHRIGVHQAGAAKETTSRTPGGLRPFLPTAGLSEIDVKRSLGLAYLEASNREKQAHHAQAYHSEALKRLTELQHAGLRDSAVDAALARLSFDLQRPDVSTHAERALAHADLAAQDRCNALFLIADAHDANGRPGDALPVLRELTTLRRHAVDYLLLAKCERAAGNDAAEHEALTTAVRINPRLWRVHQHLAERARRAGDKERAKWHELRAVP
jgi:Doubled CXXCH motif (Paired_CXXCH_1)